MWVQSPMLIVQAGKDCRLRHNVNAINRGFDEWLTLTMAAVINTMFFIVNSYVYSVSVICLLLYVLELCGVLNS